MTVRSRLVLLPLLSDSTVAGYASAGLFGVSFLAVVAAITSCAREALHPGHWTGAIAALTVCFSLGQSVGPILADAVSDGASEVSAGLVVGGSLLLVSTFTVLLQRAPREKIAVR